MNNPRTMAMTADDIRLLQEAVVLLLAVKHAARVERDAKLVELLGQKLFAEDQHGEHEESHGV